MEGPSALGAEEDAAAEGVDLVLDVARTPASRANWGAFTMVEGPSEKDALMEGPTLVLDVAAVNRGTLASAMEPEDRASWKEWASEWATDLFASPPTNSAFSLGCCTKRARLSPEVKRWNNGEHHPTPMLSPPALATSTASPEGVTPMREINAASAMSTPSEGCSSGTPPSVRSVTEEEVRGQEEREQGVVLAELEAMALHQTASAQHAASALHMTSAAAAEAMAGHASMVQQAAASALQSAASAQRAATSAQCAGAPQAAAAEQAAASAMLAAESAAAAAAAAQQSAAAAARYEEEQVIRRLCAFSGTSLWDQRGVARTSGYEPFGGTESEAGSDAGAADDLEGTHEGGWGWVAEWPGAPGGWPQEPLSALGRWMASQDSVDAATTPEETPQVQRSCIRV